MEDLSILWLRRDLRLDDNKSLFAALENTKKVQPVFIFDTDILARFKNPKDRRITFIANALIGINNELKQKGGKLLVFYGSSRKLLPVITKKLNVAHVFAGQDYEPSNKERDRLVSEELGKFGAKLVLQNDHLLVTPEEITKPDKTPYRVFTPYSKIWLQRLSSEHTRYYEINDVGRYLNNLSIESLNLEYGVKHLLEQIGYEYVDLPEYFTASPKFVLDQFLEEKIVDYKIQRDFMGEEGTSKLSPYIRFGLISIRECYREAIHRGGGAGTWINELIWRDFYTAILHYFPFITDLEFLPQFRGLKWSHNQKKFTKWQNGETGYPIVDAAMRQLAETGWMHNRARMITASFLTKHLLIDWRMGEEHFAQFLMDYELSSNIGGWQWAASTGTDPQPYFRVFNPTLQAIKFDPEGRYIKKYVHELQDVPEEYIFEPRKYLDLDYSKPIVEHKYARYKAIKFFKKAKEE
jgi:deoxyribodipyrimidine photo-lyase